MANVKSDKSKLAAGLLGIFLGSFGVHNFYLGYTNKTVVQLLLTVVAPLVSIPLMIVLVGFVTVWAAPLAAAIWGLTEGILILCSKSGTDWHKDAEGKELQD